MKLSVSYLGIKKDLKRNIEKLVNTNIDYIHLDVMDDKYVNNKSLNFRKVKFLKKINKPLDVHLMVKDVFKYIDKYKKLKPEFITFHYEATSDPLKVINYIKSNNIKVGISINPETSVAKIQNLLEYIDLVLIMSVNPGEGGQEFIKKTYDKLEYLNRLKGSFLVSVDGGINEKNVRNIKADIIVVGTFITDGNYKEQVEKLLTLVN